MFSFKSENLSIPLGGTFDVANGQRDMIKSLNLKH